jgi:hypothetical protein
MSQRGQRPESRPAKTRGQSSSKKIWACAQGRGPGGHGPGSAPVYEDNAACVAQMQQGYIKSNVTKHISPKLFYPHQLQQSGEIKIMYTKSCDNLADLFTKSLPYSTFRICVKGISMRRLRDLLASGGVSLD